MEYEEAKRIVDEFVNKSVENQKNQGNEFAYAYLTGQLSVHLAKALSGETDHVAMMMQRMTKNIPL